MTISIQKRRWMLLVFAIICLLVLVFALYLALKKDEEPVPTTQLPRMANLPPPEVENNIPPPPSYPPDAPVLEQARKALREGISPTDAVSMALALPERPERADAVFLLMEYAAESGNAEAALAVGRFYDPADDGPSGSIRKNPSTAYEWYRKALGSGQQQAKAQLAELRRWVAEKATDGSKEAQELLNNWR